MYKPMQDLSRMTDAWSKASVGYERVQEVMDAQGDVRDTPGATSAPRFRGAIEFENVSFGYEPECPVLPGLSLRVEAGQLAAIVGPTGAGKTSIISLIPRFYEPWGGVIRIDGHDIRSFRQKSLREQISFVLQDTVLFRAPIWRNIA